MDATIEHPFHNEKGEAYLEALDEYFTEHLAGNSTEAEQVAEVFAEMNDVREWIGLGKLGFGIKQLCMSDPEAAKRLERGDLRVFTTFGAIHTGLYHKLLKMGLHPSRDFSDKPFTFTPPNAALREKLLARDGLGLSAADDK